MKKLIIILGSTLGGLLILIILLIVLSLSSGDSNLTAGTYIYGQDIPARGYMYQLGGPGEVIINTSEGQEVYYRELKEGESVHEHYLPLEEGDKLTITDDAEVELI